MQISYKFLQIKIINPFIPFFFKQADVEDSVFPDVGVPSESTLHGMLQKQVFNTYFV